MANQRTPTAAVAAAAVLMAAIIVAAAPFACGRQAVEPKRFLVQGRVFCDTCRAGFETPATAYLAGAKVQIQCRARINGAVTYSAEGVTDARGMYQIAIFGDREDDICEASLLSSPQKDCATPIKGRERSRIQLTSNNGLVSYTRFANAIGFLKDVSAKGCATLLQQYEQDQV